MLNQYRKQVILKKSQTVRVESLNEHGAKYARLFGGMLSVLCDSKINVRAIRPIGPFDGFAAPAT